MSPPQDGTAGLWGFRAIRRSGPAVGMDPYRLWPTLPSSSPSGCSASALLAALTGTTRGACRPRLGMPPAQQASRHTPAQNHADGATVVCSNRSYPPCSPPTRQPLKSGLASLKCPACREICACNRHYVKSHMLKNATARASAQSNNTIAMVAVDNH